MNFLFVSGVVLANASLDIAFHDTVFISLFSLIFSNNKFDLNSSDDDIKLAIKLDNEYIKMFWVGLMDGSGSIQVNLGQKESLEYRLIIKLPYTSSNYNMLVKIAKVIGGVVKKIHKDTNVIWVINKEKDIEKILKIYEDYPPLSSKLICQLAFLKKCLTQKSVKTYLFNRNSKYNKQLDIISSKVNMDISLYFKCWLSGFIESKGCFSLNPCFSIGQENDIYLIQNIQKYFEITNKIKNPYNKFYFLEVYKKEVLLNIVIHCKNYPLLGEKLKSLNKFKKKI
jgi:hypothetical protein